MTVPIEFVAMGRPSSVNATSAKKWVWKKIVQDAADAELVRVHAPNPTPGPCTHDVTVKVFYFPKNRQYIDIDNGLKHTIDAIAPKPVLHNDKLVQRLVVERFALAAGASMKVSILAAPTLAKAVRIATGQAMGNAPVHVTAVKVEAYAANGGALW